MEAEEVDKRLEKKEKKALKRTRKARKELKEKSLEYQGNLKDEREGELLLILVNKEYGVLIMMFLNL